MSTCSSWPTGGRPVSAGCEGWPPGSSRSLRRSSEVGDGYLRVSDAEIGRTACPPGTLCVHRKVLSITVMLIRIQTAISTDATVAGNRAGRRPIPHAAATADRRSPGMEAGAHPQAGAARWRGSGRQNLADRPDLRIPGVPGGPSARLPARPGGSAWLGPLFADGLDPRTVLSNLELHVDADVDVERDLVFFNEVGGCQPALDSLKYFAEARPQAFVCASGSNVGLLDSFPVGKVR